MPPEAIRSRISYWPNRSGPDDGTAASGSSRFFGGAAPGAEAGGVTPGAVFGFGRARPESVSEIILSTSVSEESFGRAGVTGIEGVSPGITGAGGVLPAPV